MKYIPILGIVIFMLLYIYSSTLYPGGSQFDQQSIGFDWVNNYWCNLMNSEAVNGEYNPGNLFAKSGMVILCVSMALFFVSFSKYYCTSQFWKPIIKYGGIISMLFACLIFTKYHDSMSIISSVFGLFVTVGIIKELYQGDFKLIKRLSIICLILLLANNYLYYSGQYLEYLPLLQKVSFLIVLLWIALLHFRIIQEMDLKAQKSVSSL